MSQAPGRGEQWRAQLAVAMLGVLLLLLGLRLHGIQVLDHEVWSQRARRQQHRVETLPPPRGDVRIHDGERTLSLCASVPASSVFVSPRLLADRDAALSALAATLELSPRQVAEARERFRRGLGTWLSRRVTPELGDAVADLKLRGVEIREEPRRAYPFGRLAAHVAGLVSVDGQGLAGIERRFDSRLRGKAGRREVEVDNTGRAFVTARTREVPVRCGDDVQLTLDRTVQRVLEAELDKAMERWRSQAAWGVLVEVGTGRVLAMATRPGFDPVKPGADPQAARRNRVITDLYEPGSTIKPLVVASALEAGVLTLEETIFCENGSWRMRGRRKPISDVHAYGSLAVADVLVKSSNVGACKIALKVGTEKLRQTLELFGLGRRLGVQLPGEVAGSMPGLRRPSRLHMASVAQGYALQVTALQMATAYAAIAGDGRRPRLTIVDDGQSPDRALRPSLESGSEMVRVVSEATARSLREPMARVVTEGTARRARIAEYALAGKTGTTKKLVGGRYSETLSLLSFAGFAPADDPRLSFCIVVDQPDPATGGRYAGTVAAPIAAAVVREALQHLGVPSLIADGR